MRVGDHDAFAGGFENRGGLTQMFLVALDVGDVGDGAYVSEQLLVLVILGYRAADDPSDRAVGMLKAKLTAKRRAIQDGVLPLLYHPLPVVGKKRLLPDFVGDIGDMRAANFAPAFIDIFVTSG